MKLERVALTGFLSHGETDWSPNGARLVSLVGSNGAGKSSLLDAVAYALFDDARARTDDLVQLGATAMSATVEFTFDEARYRVVRGRSTRAGGKSYLELHVQAPDGTWRPMTRESIRETQEAIADLLRLDPATFRTAVLLGQGEGNRFAEATAAERKRVLSQILQLDVYARAEEHERQAVREIEARRVLDEQQRDRLAAQVADLEPAGDARDRALVEATRLDAILDERRSARKAAEATLEALTTHQAAAAVRMADYARVKDELVDLANRWQRTTAAIAAAREVLAGADDVAAAAVAVPAARKELGRLLELATQSNRLRDEEAAAQRTLTDVERRHDQELVAWRSRHEAIVERIRKLEAAAAAGDRRCEACGQPISDQAALDQLTRLRRERDALGTEPKAPLELARASAAVQRVASRRRELGWDPTLLGPAEEKVRDLERTAARGEAIAAARVTLEREEASLAEITAAGTAARARKDELEAVAAEAADLEAQVAEARDELARIVAGLEQTESERRDVERLMAQAEAALERHEQLRDELAALEERLAAAELEVARIRKLVGAFGVTGIPARIIESVLPELAGYANELLGQLRPGVSLELRAQRAKKDGKGVVEALDLVVRDEAGERPLALFSGGERMSVSLALAVGLSRLVARRAGTAIKTLAVDEPDGLDADARRAFGQALRVIAHRGDLERVLVISHHEDLAEFADEVYEVTKGPGGSRVTAAA